MENEPMTTTPPMSLPTDPQAQLAQLLELNGEIIDAQITVSRRNDAALDAARAAGIAQEDLEALWALRDDLLMAMKSTAPAETVQ